METCVTCRDTDRTPTQVDVHADPNQAPAMSPSDRDGRGSTLHIGLFFDGTRNNADNLQRASRPAGATTPTPRPPAVVADDASPYQSRLTSSYSNGLTNIARLHALYPDHRQMPAAGNTLALSLYNEGVGTRTGEDGDLLGLAFGIGRTGVRAKRRRALEQLLPNALRQLTRAHPGRILGSVGWICSAIRVARPARATR